MIESLTQEQIDKMPWYVEKYTALGLATGPADRAACEEALRLAYTLGKCEAPKTIIWGRSPMEGTIKAAFLHRDDLKGAKEWEGFQVPQNLKGAANEVFQNCVYAQHEAGWVAFYAFMRDELKIPGCEMINGLEGLMGCGWVWPFDEAAVMTERPSALSLDDRGRLHHEERMAISYPDGWGVYCWHGVRVPEVVILSPDSLTADMVRQETNAEIQRIMVERMGAAKYLQECKAKVLDVDSLTLVGSAPRALMEDDLGNKWLIGTDGSTKRVYTMSVPRESTSCSGAHRLISGLDKEDRLVAEC